MSHLLSQVLTTVARIKEARAVYLHAVVLVRSNGFPQLLEKLLGAWDEFGVQIPLYPKVWGVLWWDD